MTQTGQARESSDANPGLLGGTLAAGLTFPCLTFSLLNLTVGLTSCFP